MQQTKRNLGFTLVELMVTIAVLAIIAMMAAPSFGDIMMSQDLNKSTQELVGQLNNARSKAVLERRDVTVDLNPDDADKAKGDTDNKLIWIPQKKAILKSGSPTEITFQLSGGVKNFAANIDGKPFVICNKNGGNKSKNISISLMGTVQVTEGTCQ